jgi:diguanylate cyclase (GGDEF)-like protein
MATGSESSASLDSGDDAPEREIALIEHLSGLEQRYAALEEVNRHLRADLERAERLAHMDPLTGLGNRRYFDLVAPAELRRASRLRNPLTLFLCDVDYFKSCNDLHGHDAGDAVLIGVAAVLRTFCRRGGDLAIRYGGDEFALLLPGIDARAATQFGDDLRKAVQDSDIHESHGRGMQRQTLSIGSATFHGAHVCSSAELVRAADRALYKAKRDGRNRTATAACGPRLSANG